MATWPLPPPPKRTTRNKKRGINCGGEKLGEREREGGDGRKGRNQKVGRETPQRPKESDERFSSAVGGNPNVHQKTSPGLFLTSEVFPTQLFDPG